MTFWRWVALVLTVAFATVYLMGRRLPREHHAIAEGVVEASQDRVWQLVDDSATQTQWRTGLSKITPLQNTPEGRCWVEAHRSAVITLCQVVEAPKSRLVIRIADNTSYGGTWTYMLRPTGENTTEVTMEEDGWVRNPLMRFLGHYVIGGDTNVKQFLHDLQAEAVRSQ